MPMNIVLVNPEIPQNTGNIARTCAATGSHLHLIRPLGFDISDKAVKRAGLDYWPLVHLSVYDNLEAFFQQHPQAKQIQLQLCREYTVQAILQHILQILIFSSHIPPFI